MSVTVPAASSAASFASSYAFDASFSFLSLSSASCFNHKIHPKKPVVKPKHYYFCSFYGPSWMRQRKRSSSGLFLSTKPVVYRADVWKRTSCGKKALYGSQREKQFCSFTLQHLFWLRIRKLKRFLNLISHENSEFFKAKTRFQTGGVGFENGPPFYFKKTQVWIFLIFNFLLIINNL